MTSEAHYAHCGALVRERDRDLWLACLFAPLPARRHIHAVYAYVIETSDVRARVTQPLLGEMRLRWWADAIEAADPAAGQDNAGHGARAHPVADALLDTIARFGLPRDELAKLAEERMRFDLYDDPPETMAAVEDYCRATVAAPMRWSARILGADPCALAFDGAGVALGLTRILRALPAHAQTQSLLPLDLLARNGVAPDDIRARHESPSLFAALSEMRAAAQARYESARLQAQALTMGREALLPAATTPLFLERMARKEYHPFQPLAEPSPLRRQWRLWRAARGVGL